MAHQLSPAGSTCVTDMKIILTGSLCAGKTCLFERFNNNVFDPYALTAGVGGSLLSKQVLSNGWRVTLNIWDTAGCERFKSVNRLYFRGAEAAVVCFDLTVQGSFEEAKDWMTEVKNMEPECKIYLCGSKKDLLDDGVPRAGSISEILRYAEETQSTYIETSSKTGENVDQLLQKIGHDYTAVPENIRPVPAKDKAVCVPFLVEVHYVQASYFPIITLHVLLYSVISVCTLTM